MANNTKRDKDLIHKVTQTKAEKESRISYVPLEISRTSFMPAKAWELLPGLRLEKISKKFEQKIKEIDSRCFPHLNFHLNFAVCIENETYSEYLKKKLTMEGKSLPYVPEVADPILSDARNLAKLVLISLILQENFNFAIGQSYGFKVNKLKQRKEYKNSGIAITHTERSYLYQYPLPIRKKKFNRQNILFAVKSLERYFRPYIWDIDRLSMALNFFWSALTARSPEQVFLNLTILLECLLTTSNQSVTRFISERMAILLGKNLDEHNKIFRLVKKIYDQRSRIVHGECQIKKGITNCDSYYLFVKNSRVPQRIFEKLIEFSINLLNVIIRDKELLLIIQQQGKKEKKISRDLDELFRRRINNSIC